MKLLLVSFYFPPDLCAGSFRAIALLRSLKKEIGKDDLITVLTTKPNRYSDFIKDSSDTEIKENVTIVRIKLPVHKNGFFDQSICFFVFFIKVFLYLINKKYDLVVATSSRLFTAFLAKLISKWKNIPLYLDIRDIFFEVFQDLTRKSYMRLFLPLIKMIEKFTFSNTKKINLVSRGFHDYFLLNYRNNSLSFHTNGIDGYFQSYDWCEAENSRIKVAYAGNIGDGQGLHKILPELAEVYSNTHDFFVLGNGGKINDLKRAIKNKKLNNIFLLATTNREALTQYYNSANILFLHLNDLPAFSRVLPSKIFEYAATGKPILAGVSGYAKDFINQEIKNANVFEPCSIKDAKKAMNGLEIRMCDRSDFKKKFDREVIMNLLAKDILD